MEREWLLASGYHIYVTARNGAPAVFRPQVPLLTAREVMNDNPCLTLPGFVSIQRKAKFDRCPLLQGKEWIRIPSIIYASTLLTVVLVILGEEMAGTHATPHLPIVLLANLPWLLFPIYIIYRMWRYPYPFTMPYEAIEEQVAQSFHEHTGASGGF